MKTIRKELDRDYITTLTNDIVNVERLLDFMADHGDNVTTSDFHIFRVEDDFYIYHLDTGLCLSWYKHFGRCAAFTLTQQIQT